MIEPQWATDDIKIPLKAVISSVARKQKIEHRWMNDELEIWASPEARNTIFAQAYEQNIILFRGESILILAAPFEWALERKIRSIALSERGKKIDLDMEDALAIFRHFRKASQGPLDMEYFRYLNMNGFDILPERHHLEKIATLYQNKYKVDLFNPATDPGESSTSACSEWSWSEE